MTENKKNKKATYTLKNLMNSLYSKASLLRTVVE